MTKDDSPADGELLGLLVLAADGYFAIGGFLRLLSSRKKGRLSRLPSLPHASGTVHWFSASCLHIKTLWDVKRFTSNNRDSV